MFFPQKIVSIKPSDRVLEIGPGATPYHRSDVFLEKEYDTEEELIAQSGRVGILQTDKEVVRYKGDAFPFKDKEFDYVVCSHVLEHVDNVDFFLSELQRVGKRGYLEFPTIYYDYIYNFAEHTQFLLHMNDTIRWISKSDSQLSSFEAVQEFFYVTLEKKHYDFINAFKPYFFQGFEWENTIHSKRVDTLDEVCFNREDLRIEPYNAVHSPADFDYNSISIRKALKFTNESKIVRTLAR